VTATSFILVGVILILMVGIGVVLRLTFSNSNTESGRVATLTGSQASTAASMNIAPKVSHSKTNLTLEEVQSKLIQTKGRAVNQNDPEILFFRAGYFSTAERLKFLRFKHFLQIALPIAVGGLMSLVNGVIYIVIGIACGYMVGRVFPDHILNKRIKRRKDDSLYYLPLVIEQISIGVSSSLDVGPCVAYVVEMADERSSHNVVTELLAQVLKLMKAGMSLDEALSDVGEVVGIGEVKNAFMFLAQCSKHGGEISKQLNDLAEAVTLSRQLDIEARIVALPTKASGALGLIFFGFFIMLLAGLFVRIMSSMAF
jgi:pilus assembly protein TadC